MDELIIEAIERSGYLGIFLLMALENIIPPVPSELIMGVGGVLVARGSMEFWPLLIAGTAGSTAGNLVLFWIGRKLGYRRLEPIVERWGRWLTVEWEHVEKASEFLRRHGHWVVFGLRFSPFLRSVISLPAGLVHMPVGKFIVFTFAGAAIWNVALVKGGEWLAGFLDESQDSLGWIILGLVVASIIAYVWRLVTWEPKAERAGTEGGKKESHGPCRH